MSKKDEAWQKPLKTLLRLLRSLLSFFATIYSLAIMSRYFSNNAKFGPPKEENICDNPWHSVCALVRKKRKIHRGAKERI